MVQNSIQDIAFMEQLCIKYQYPSTVLLGNSILNFNCQSFPVRRIGLPINFPAFKYFCRHKKWFKVLLCRLYHEKKSNGSRSKHINVRSDLHFHLNLHFGGKNFQIVITGISQSFLRFYSFATKAIYLYLFTLFTIYLQIFPHQK